VTVRRDHLAHVTADGDVVAGGGEGSRLWPFTQSRRRPRRSTRPEHLDPVNGIVLRSRPEEVVAALSRQGWARPSDGAVHRTWIDGRPLRMADHTALGDRQERVHVRLFALGAHTLLAAHHEVMNDRGRHIVTSWDRARQTVGAALEAEGFAPLAPSGVVTVEGLRDVAGDGRVWRWVGGGG